MRYFLAVIPLCILTCCSPKNPYYKGHFSSSGYNVFFEIKQEPSAYNVSGENTIGNNTFNATLPDSLGGAYTVGECVIEILRNDIENHTTEVRLVGINIHNRQTDKFIGFDRYHPTFRKVQYKPSDNVKIYLPFINKIVEGWTFQKKYSTGKTKNFAYCKIIFHASK
ncbi:MAG: hypothetical protein J0M10_18965 [Chitinophagales bacterium]|nr:hypothetical protein [Chitinophagales bacterium]